MVGKLDSKNLDRIERPPDYRVESALETQDQDRGKGGEGAEEDEYSASSGVKGWQKYHTDARNRRAVKIRRRDIARISLNQPFLQKGLVIVDANIQLVNGQILKNAYLFSTKIDVYWKLKRLNAGQEVPINELVTEEYAEASVLVKGMIVSSDRGKTPKFRPEETVKRGKPPIMFSWAALAVYSVIIVLVLIAIFLLL